MGSLEKTDSFKNLKLSPEKSIFFHTSPALFTYHFAAAFSHQNYQGMTINLSTL
jgi:hypothetical protein